MFAARYFAGRYFPRRYFPALGSGVTTVAITNGEVSILTTATVIYNATLAARVRLVTGEDEPIYIGANTVTTANGFPLPCAGYGRPGDHTFDVPSGTALYGIARTATKLRYIASE